MSEIAELTVLINGDVSGLTNAVKKAQEEIDSISTYAQVGYGDGKFSNARQRYNGWEKSGQRSVDERIKWWQNAMNVYSYDANVYWEAQRNIYELERERAEEANNIAEKYIKNKRYFADGTGGTDAATAAFGEYGILNAGFLDKALISGEEYNNNLYNFGKKLYEGREELSERWLEHEERYNNLSADAYIEGLKRIGSYTQEYYNNGLIDFQTYSEARQRIQDGIIDKTAEKSAAEYDNWKNDADTWYELRSTFGDWDYYDDSAEKFFRRKRERIGEFYAGGKISFEEYTNAQNQVKLDFYNSQVSEYDMYLKEYADAITRQKNAFSRQEQALRDSWSVSDRRENMSDLRSEISFYENSVTERGKDKLQSLKSELRDEERNEQLYELQQKNNAVLEVMQNKYDMMESNKSTILKNIACVAISMEEIETGIQSAVNAAKVSIEATNSATYSLLNDIYKTIRCMNGGNSYTDSRNISISSSVSQSDIIKMIEKSFVFGLSGLKYNGKVY